MLSRKTPLGDSPLRHIQDLANALQSAQPKIQRMCEEESDDSEAVAKLLEINDSIHRTIERYKLIKKGDLAAASKIPKGTLGTSTGVGKTSDNELSLIDFDGDSEPSVGESASQSVGGQHKSESLEDDLLGLSFQDKNYGQSGGIALGFGANTSESLQAILFTGRPVKVMKLRCPWAVIALIFHTAEFRKSPYAQHHTSTTTEPRYKQAQL